MLDQQSQEARNQDDPTRKDEIRAAMGRVEHIARLTDTNFGIPGTRIRFGLDAIVGLIPGIGDLVGLLMSLWLFSEAWRMGAPSYVKRRMLTNMGIDFGVGLVPLIGDLLDVAFKANVRNQNLLKEWLAGELRKVDEPKEENYLLGAVGLIGFTAMSLLVIGWVSGNIML